MTSQTTVELRTLKRGEYFKLPGMTAVYVRGEYDRTSKKFECYKFEDINKRIFYKGTKSVVVGFTF